MVTVVFRVKMPDELLQLFLQTLRDFDTRHDPKHEGRVELEQMIDSDWPVEKMQAVFDAIKPPMPYSYVKKLDS